MTENIPQTSASERYEAARKALAEYNHQLQNEGEWGTVPNRLAAAIRALITPPGSPLTVESEAVNDAVNAYDWPFHEHIDISATELADFGTQLFRAGVQSAHETWEPADVPSQEMMLRWLGLRYSDAGRPTHIHIPFQTIEKEEV